MKLIIMPSRQGQYAPITLSVSRLVVLVALLLVAAMIAGAVLQRLVWKLQPETQPSALVVAAMAPSPSASVAADNQTVHLLATKVGELQATIKRLDGLGRRVAKVAGLPDGDVSVASETPEAAVVLDDLWVPLPPGPHVHLGYPLNFWEFVTRIDEEPDPREIGHTLRQCHEIMSRFPEPLPKLAILTESLTILNGRELFANSDSDFIQIANNWSDII